MLKLNYILAGLVLLFLFLFACSNSQQHDNNKGEAKIQFYKTEFDFGTVKMGEKLMHDFMFKNIGDGDLLISNIKTDCGCTAAKFDSKAIKAGEESLIEVVFSSDGFPGFQTKSITVFTNAGDSTVLRVAAVVDYELNNVKSN